MTVTERTASATSPGGNRVVQTGEHGRSRLRIGDLFAVGTIGLRVRRLRTFLTSLGIAIGVAALVAVVGISGSSRADLLAEIDGLGTNLLQVHAGDTMFGQETELPTTAPSMIRRIAPVESAAATRIVGNTTVRRNDLVPEGESGGIAVVATEPNLLETAGATLAAGVFLNDATSEVPAVVLGSETAERLGITSLEDRPLVYISGHWFNVVGILDPVPLGPDLDRSALIGYPIAQELFDIDDAPSTVRVRVDPDHVLSVRDVLAATTNPEAPENIEVTRPSDAVAAKEAADETLTALLLGLGAVALLVGGVGIANVMVISVLERRGEIGVRRALGATRRHIRAQFLVESTVLSALGGVLGVGIGTVITAVYVDHRGWPLSIPMEGLALAVAASLAAGALAGVYPSMRASRVAPADAVRAD